MFRSFLAVAVVCLVGCSEAPKPEKPTFEVWRPAATFSGHDNSQTESFQIDTAEWRIRWTAHADSSAPDGILKIAVHSTVSGRVLEDVVEHRGPGAGTAYVHEDPRTFFLVIESDRLQWTVTVEAPMQAQLAEPKPGAN